MNWLHLSLRNDFADWPEIQEIGHILDGKVSALWFSEAAHNIAAAIPIPGLRDRFANAIIQAAQLAHVGLA